MKKPVKPYFNRVHRMDGLDLLRWVGSGEAAAVFLDPQYRALLDKMDYGNDKSPRAALPQMTASTIIDMRCEVARVLRPGGYLFQWTDKLEALSGRWGDQVALGWKLDGLHLVDMITWEKARWGNGYRSRRKSEFLLVLQCHPKGIKTWKDHSIPDVWGPVLEKSQRERLYAEGTYKGVLRQLKTAERPHPHLKPLGLQSRLVECVTWPGDLVLDPCAGGRSVLEVCRLTGRSYLGSDLRG